MSNVIKCDRCKRRMRNIEGWNGIFRQGVAVGALCPGCQTPEENAEAEVHEAIYNYRQDDSGRLFGAIKTGAS